MRIFTLTAILTILAMLGGCSTVQKIQKVDRINFNNVCIVEHTAVKEGVLEAIKETLSARGIKTHVVAGSYVKTNNMWLPSYQLSDVATCDAVLFYVANWNWDIAMYMHFANIWVVSSDSKKTRLGSASYDARASLNKFINARQKIVELTSELLGVDLLHSTNTIQAQTMVNRPSKNELKNVDVRQNAEPIVDRAISVSDLKGLSAPPSVRDDSVQLEKLKNLKDRGVITEDEFIKKKKEILDRM